MNKLRQMRAVVSVESVTNSQKFCFEIITQGVKYLKKQNPTNHQRRLLAVTDMMISFTDFTQTVVDRKRQARLVMHGYKNYWV